MRLLASFRDYLEAERVRINGQIGSYPSPIPACDAQFNYLLEKRSRLSADLNRVDQLLASGLADGTDAPDIEDLVEKIRRIDTQMARKSAAAVNIDTAG